MDYQLKADDFVGVTFWIISVSMVASTAFFFFESNSVARHWQTSVRVAGLVTLIAAVHYYYMRDVWVATGESPTVYRYIDWLLTVPLQMIEFYLNSCSCWRSNRWNFLETSNWYTYNAYWWFYG